MSGQGDAAVARLIARYQVELMEANTEADAHHTVWRHNVGKGNGSKAALARRKMDRARSRAATLDEVITDLIDALSD
jgi:microcompartment protein CcmK/EutM